MLWGIYFTLGVTHASISTKDQTVDGKEYKKDDRDFLDTKTLLILFRHEKGQWQENVARAILKSSDPGSTKKVNIRNYRSQQRCHTSPLAPWTPPQCSRVKGVRSPRSHWPQNPARPLCQTVGCQYRGGSTFPLLVYIRDCRSDSSTIITGLVSMKFWVANRSSSKTSGVFSVPRDSLATANISFNLYKRS